MALTIHDQAKGMCAISTNITQPLVQKEEETVNRVAQALNEIFARCILADVPRGGTVYGLGTFALIFLQTPFSHRTRYHPFHRR